MTSTVQPIKTVEPTFRPRPLREEESKKIHSLLGDYLGRLEQAFKRKDWTTHAKVGLACIRWMRRVPIYYLREFGDAIAKRIRTHGSRHVLSVTMDFAWRLLRQRDVRSIATYKDIADAYEKAERAGRGPTIVIMRSRSHAYRAYSENVGWAVSRLLFSRFGEKQVALGYEPATFLRIIGLLDSCQKRAAKEKDGQSWESAIRRKREVMGSVDTCALLAREVSQKLSGAGEGDFSTAMEDIGTAGFRMGPAECISSLMEDRGAADLVERFENYVACERGPQHGNATPASWVADGYAFDTRGNVNYGIPPSSDRSHLHYDSNTDRWTEVTDKTYKFPNDNDPSAYVWVHGESDGPMVIETYDRKTGYYTKETHNTDNSIDVEWNDGQGNSGWAHQNSNGTTGSSGKTENLGGGVTQTTEVTRDENGNTTETTVTVETDNGDGTTTTETFTYDGDGNEVTTSKTTSASTPVEDTTPNPCFEQLFDDPRDSKVDHAVGRLDPYINPAPDAVNESDDPCLAGFGSMEPTKCTSAFLCLDGQVDENCGCSGGHSGSLPPDSGACSQMMCSDGADCDPATGTCSTSHLGGGQYWEPGIGPPNPPVAFSTTVSLGPSVSGLPFGALPKNLNYVGLLSAYQNQPPS